MANKKRKETIDVAMIKSMWLKLDRQKDGSYWVGVQIFGLNVTIPVDAVVIRSLHPEISDFLLELTDDTDEFVLIRQSDFEAMRDTARPARSTSGWGISGASSGS